LATRWASVWSERHADGVSFAAWIAMFAAAGRRSLDGASLQGRVGMTIDGLKIALRAILRQQSLSLPALVTALADKGSRDVSLRDCERSLVSLGAGHTNGIWSLAEGPGATPSGPQARDEQRPATPAAVLRLAERRPLDVAESAVQPRGQLRGGEAGGTFVVAREPRVIERCRGGA
jgi:hypothetical protein